jgi:hypothetical protein
VWGISHLRGVGRSAAAREGASSAIAVAVAASSVALRSFRCWDYVVRALGPKSGTQVTAE